MPPIHPQGNFIRGTTFKAMGLDQSQQMKCIIIMCGPKILALWIQWAKASLVP
jgi:hypothetical protein